MKHLYDTSALLNTVRMHGEKTLSYIRGNYILSLTPYEIGNALWKETTLLRSISLEEAEQLLGLIELLLRYLNIVDPRNKQLVLEVAHELGVTYYDASHIVAAYELEAVLVTDDKMLRSKIEERRDLIRKILPREITVYTSEEIT